MSDIFMSYASADRPSASAIAKRLEQEGWSVWWDRKIVPGQTFDRVIEEALDAARCVVVLWSKNSRRSDWVRNEATIGHRRGVLVPAFIETAALPLEFLRIQTANLSGWEQQSSGSELTQFLDAIERVLTCQGLTQKPATALPQENIERGESLGAPDRDRLNGDRQGAWWKSGIRIIALSIVTCLSILGLFKAIYPETNPLEATTAIAILSLLGGAGLNFLWLFLRVKHRGN